MPFFSNLCLLGQKSKYNFVGFLVQMKTRKLLSKIYDLYLAHVRVLSWSKDSSTVLNWFWQQDINIRNESCWPNSTNKVWPWIIQFCIYYTKSITITKVVSSQLGLVVNYKWTKVNTWYNPQKVATTPFKITLQILFNYCNQSRELWQLPLS